MKIKLKYADVATRFPGELAEACYALRKSKSKFKNNPIESFKFYIVSAYQNKESAIPFYTVKTVNERLQLLLSNTKAKLVMRVPNHINSWYHVSKLKTLPAEVVLYCMNRAHNL